MGEFCLKPMHNMCNCFVFQKIKIKWKGAIFSLSYKQSFMSVEIRGMAGSSGLDFEFEQKPIN